MDDPHAPMAVPATGTTCLGDDLVVVRAGDQVAVELTVEVLARPLPPSLVAFVG